MSVTFSLESNPAHLQDTPIELNLSNSNAAIVMQALGYEFDYCGTIEPKDICPFIQRCDLALAAINQFPSLDSGREPEESTGEKGARWIDCGVPAGYLYERISQLRALAMIAWEYKTYITFA